MPIPHLLEKYEEIIHQQIEHNVDDTGIVRDNVKRALYVFNASVIINVQKMWSFVVRLLMIKGYVKINQLFSSIFAGYSR